MDVGENANLKCITEHPGFNLICLQKWSLRMSADRYKTKSKAKYAQTQKEGKKTFYTYGMEPPYLTCGWNNCQLWKVVCSSKAKMAKIRFFTE
jgi:hypothetical protein